MKKLLLLLGCVSLAGCLGSTEPPDNPSDPTTETFATGLGVDLSQMQKISVGGQFVWYKDLSVGTGVQLTSPASSVIITYAGFLKNGAIFNQGQSVAIPLSGSLVGFQQGMIGMKEGGERLIVIPSALGYGNSPFSPVPPNSTLVFDVRLESIP
jgi:FKBP-type peptidyl-prolyl cis-trans isomerase